MKKQSLLADFQILQTHLWFVHPCDNQVSDTDHLFWFHQHYMLLRENVLQNRMVDPDVPYMDTIRAVHYKLNLLFTPSK